MSMPFNCGEIMMNSVNFNQLLCKSISENGEDISGIFDTLVCDRGRNHFTICVFFTQILAPEATYQKYYYRIVLRQLGKSRAEMKSYRIDNGVFWDDEEDINQMDHADFTHHKTTRPGFSGKLCIDYGFDFDVPGNYEVDLYVKKMEASDTHDSFQKLSVKDLELVSLCPFQVIFQNS